jgi:pimeloyl-ACP methyl ester carboxylesterase
VKRLTLPDRSRLAYNHLPGDTPGILFCPGFNSDMQGTKALALEDWCREQGIQFTRFDYFGHGESDGTVEGGTIGRWRDDALAILDQVTRGPQLIVGSSMGGWIMLLAALARPQRVAGLVGIAPAPDFSRRIREHRLDELQLRQLEETGYCQMPSAYGDPYRISREMLEEGEKHLLLNDEIPIDLPVRLIHGQRDDDVPWETSLDIARLLRSDDVEVQLVKQGDHRLSEPRDLRRLLGTVSELWSRLVSRSGGGGNAGSG